jgi:hypothetical protein
MFIISDECDLACICCAVSANRTRRGSEPLVIKLKLYCRNGAEQCITTSGPQICQRFYLSRSSSSKLCLSEAYINSYIHYTCECIRGRPRPTLARRPSMIYTLQTWKTHTKMKKAYQNLLFRNRVRGRRGWKLMNPFIRTMPILVVITVTEGSEFESR